MVFSMNDELRSQYVIAVSRNDIEKVRFLLDQGMPIDIRHSSDFTALHFAAKKGLVDMARLLLNYRADINATNKERQTPLHVAVNEGAFEDSHLEMVLMLLKHGANASFLDRKGKTAVVMADEIGLTETVELFKKHEEQQSLENLIVDNGEVQTIIF